jgi:hypothetical protein
MMTSTKTLLLLFFSALVDSSFGWSVNIMCDRIEFNNNHCSNALVEGGTITADHQILDALHLCTLEETDENFHFDREDGTEWEWETRNLRGGEEERDLQNCDGCYCHQACCYLGYCGSSCSCTCACNDRRMSAEDEIMDILGGRKLSYVQGRIEAKCSELVGLVATELEALGNDCLGKPSEIQCHATLIE